MALPAPGDLFEREFAVAGVRIGLLAEVEVSGDRIHLKDIAIYPLDSAEVVVVGARALLEALRDELIPELQREGFAWLRITGRRLSGARPGRKVDRTLHLR